MFHSGTTQPGHPTVKLFLVNKPYLEAGLKFNIQKTKIRASGPIASLQIDGETNETVTDFYFLGLQNHCGW